ncbi:MAG: hypothetical protein ACLFP2_03080 [Candidatus Woesearchaeota archaeon]
MSNENQDNGNGTGQASSNAQQNNNAQSILITLNEVKTQDKNKAKERKDTFNNPSQEQETPENRPTTGKIDSKGFFDMATDSDKQNCKTLIFMFPEDEGDERITFDRYKNGEVNLSEASTYVIGYEDGLKGKPIPLDTTKLRRWWITRTGSKTFLLAAASYNKNDNISNTGQLRWIREPVERKLDDLYKPEKINVKAYEYYAINELIRIGFDTREPIQECSLRFFVEGTKLRFQVRGNDSSILGPLLLEDNKIQFNLPDLNIGNDINLSSLEIGFIPKDNQGNIVPVESKEINIIRPFINITQTNEQTYIGEDIDVRLQISNDTIAWLNERIDSSNKLTISFLANNTALKQIQKPQIDQTIDLQIPSEKLTAGIKQIDVKLYYPDGTELPLSGSFNVTIERPYFNITKVNGKLFENSKIERASDDKYYFGIDSPVDLSKYELLVGYDNQVEKLTQHSGKFYAKIPNTVRQGFITMVINNISYDQKGFRIDPPEQSTEPNPEQPNPDPTPEKSPENPGQTAQLPANPAQTIEDPSQIPYVTGPGPTEKTITFPNPRPQMIPYKIIFYEGRTDHDKPKAIKFQGNEQLYLGNQIDNTDQLLLPEALFNGSKVPQKPIPINRVYLVIDMKGKGYAIGPESRIQKGMRSDYFLCHVNDIIFMIESDGRVSYKIEDHSTARYLDENWHMDSDSHNGLFLQTPYKQIIFGRDRVKRLEDTMQNSEPIIKEQEKALEEESYIDENFVKEIQEQKYLGQFLVSLRKGLSDAQNTPGIFNKQKVLDQIQNSLEQFIKQNEQYMRKLFKEIEKREKEYIKINEKELKELSRLHMDKIVDTMGVDIAAQEKEISIKDYHENLIKECKQLIKSINAKYNELKEEEFRLLEGLIELYNHFVKKDRNLEKKTGDLQKEVEDLLRLDREVLRLIGEIEQLESQRESKLEELTRALPALHKAFIESNHTRAKDYIQKEVQI